MNEPVIYYPGTYVAMAEMAAGMDEFERSARLFRSAAASTNNIGDWVRLNDRAGDMWTRSGQPNGNVFDIPHSGNDDEF